MTVTDVSDARLSIALAHGHHTQSVAGDPLPTSATDFDVLLECSGAPGALAAGMRQLAPGGRATMVGIPSTDDIAVPLPLLHDREISVTANFRYANTWPLAIELVAQGRVDLSGVVTDRFPLDQARAALLAAATNAGTVKAVIDPQT